MTNVNTPTKINKVSGKQKEDLLSVIGNYLPKEDQDKLTKELMEQNIISGSDRTSNSLIIEDKNGNEFYPTFTWKPKVVGTKLGEKSSQMVQFVEDFTNLKTSFKKEVK